MAVSERDKEVLRKQLSPDEVTHRYQQAIKYFMDGAKTGIIDRMEYQTFVEMNLKRDLKAAAHAWFTMTINWNEYYNLVQALVGFDLFIQGVIESSNKKKNNGEDKEE